LTGIWSSHTGLPFTPALNFDPTNSGAAARPNRLRDGNLDAGRTIDRWFDTTAFEPPSGMVFGNSGRSILRGPRLANLDLGIHRRFRIREGLRTEVRAELFNAFNHPQFGDPGATLGTPQFGLIQSVRVPERQIQFGLKVVF
jgi:hypothetical protein